MIDHLVLLTAGVYTTWAGYKYFPISHKQAVLSAFTKGADSIAEAGNKFLADNAGHDTIKFFRFGNNNHNLEYWINSLKTKKFCAFF